MNILSLQSWVCFGHVGNAAAVFPLQRLGAEVWAVNTVQFSNHTGYGAWTGRAAAGAEVAALVEGIAARGLLGRCDAVLSGYVGKPDVGAAILDAVARVRGANPNAVYCCDPVCGDAASGIYAQAGVLEMLGAQALPAADLATPNQFELERLTGRECRSLADVIDAAEALRMRMHVGTARNVLVTSVRADTTPDDAVDVVGIGADGRFLCRTPRLGIEASGAGDVAAALFLFHLLRGARLRTALEAAVSSVFGVLRRTDEQGGGELQIIAAQEEFLAPSRRFIAYPC